MMRWDGFARSVVFGALAALLWVPWALLVGPIVGPWNARALYLIGVTAFYVAGLSPARHRAVSAAVAAAASAAAIGLVARSTAELAIGLATVLGVARGAFLYPAAPARAAVRELTLLVGGLVFARFLTSTAVPSTALAMWGFFLVQSCFFLIAGAPRRSPAAHPDPFEEAHRRALNLLGSP
jgi:hypothetical protein